MRVFVVDPPLFTLPYDRHFAQALAHRGAEVTLVGRPLRTFETLGVEPFRFRPCSTIAPSMRAASGDLRPAPAAQGPRARPWAQSARAVVRRRAARHPAPAMARPAAARPQHLAADRAKGRAGSHGPRFHRLAGGQERLVDAALGRSRGAADLRSLYRPYRAHPLTAARERGRGTPHQRHSPPAPAAGRSGHRGAGPDERRPGDFVLRPDQALQGRRSARRGRLAAGGQGLPVHRHHRRATLRAARRAQGEDRGGRGRGPFPLRPAPHPRRRAGRLPRPSRSGRVPLPAHRRQWRPHPGDRRRQADRGDAGGRVRRAAQPRPAGAGAPE